MHIGILMSNTDRSAFASQFENDGYKAATMLRGQRPNWQFTVLMTIDGELPATPSSFDGYLITGSQAGVNDTEPWMPALFDFIRNAHEEKVPIVGLCFGHQAIAHALGGQVEQASSWGLGVAQTIFDDAAAWMQPQRPALQLHAAHQDQVTGLPEGAVRLGGNEFCPIGAMAVGDHIFTTQYHPEFTPTYMRALVDGKIGPKLGDEIADQARRKLAVDVTDDSARFAQWAVQFLECAASVSPDNV